MRLRTSSSQYIILCHIHFHQCLEGQVQTCHHFSEEDDIWEEKIGLNLVGNSELFVMVEKYLTYGANTLREFLHKTDLPLHVSLARNYLKYDCTSSSLEGMSFSSF